MLTKKINNHIKLVFLTRISNNIFCITQINVFKNHTNTYY